MDFLEQEILKNLKEIMQYDFGRKLTDEEEKQLIKGWDEFKKSFDR